MKIFKEKFIPFLKPYFQKYQELFELQRAWKTREYGEKHLKTWPLKVFVEPTNRCLMRCVYCARTHMERPEGNMERENYEALLENFPKGVHFTFCGNGEPLLHKDLPWMIRRAVEKGMITAVITNAAALHHRMREALFETGLHRIQISMDTIYPDLFEKLTGKTARFEVVFKNLLDFLWEARVERKVPVFVTISAVMVQEVKKNSAFLRWFWEKLPVDNFYEGPLLTLQTYSGRYKEAAKDLEGEKYRPCVNPWTVALVDYDGTVKLCPQDFSSRWSVGKVGKGKTLFQVINGKKAYRLRKAILDRDQKFFRECGYHCDRCNAWTKKVKHAVEDWINGYLFLLAGLTGIETSVMPVYEQEKLNFLDYLRKNFSRYPEILEHLFKEFTNRKLKKAYS